MSVIAPEKDVHRLEGTTYRGRQKVALELNDRSLLVRKPFREFPLQNTQDTADIARYGKLL